MHSNECRHTIQIQRRSTSLDAYGQQSTAWDVVATTKASIRAAGRSSERLLGNQVTGALTHTIATRYQAVFGSPISMAAMRIVFNNRVINIVSARILNEKNQWVIFDCVEGSLDGQ